MTEGISIVVIFNSIMCLHGNTERVDEVRNKGCFVLRFIFVRTVRAVKQMHSIRKMTHTGGGGGGGPFSPPPPL